MSEAPATSQVPGAAVSPRRFLALLALAVVVGLVVSLVAWGFLQLVHYIQVWVYDDLPEAVGYDGGAPQWWPLPACALAGVLTAFAIVRLPGRGGHVPAHGLSAGLTPPVELPGVLLAATAALGLGIVLGPEAPLIALGAGLGALAVQLARDEQSDEAMQLMAAVGAFAAVSFIFESPLLGAILMIEAMGLGGSRLHLVLVPGLLAAGVGSLIMIGMGSWTGLDTSNFAIEPLALPSFARPDFVDFLWTVPFAAGIGAGCFAIMWLARRLLPLLESREFALLPLAGLAVAGLAIAFSESADKPFQEVLFSGQESLPGLVDGSQTWSVSALALLVLCKGLAWSICLAGFRGGPVFPALFLGAAGGLMASHLAGFAMTPAVAVGMGAAVAGILGLPLSACVIATVLTAQSGSGATPLVIVGVIVAYLSARVLSMKLEPPEVEAEPGAPASAPVATHA